MKTRKEMSISLRKWGGTAFMAIAAALTASGGYGDLPFYLETPNDLDGYRNEIALLSARRAD